MPLPSRFRFESDGPVDTCVMPTVWWVVKAGVDLRPAFWGLQWHMLGVGRRNPGGLPTRGDICLVLE